ncbi:sulfotransferase family protein [Marinicella sp. W31]|uniref:sulfotransferase family protein n=1 Tax=Marinicella sp. W31 TaxID=3023713 RepID=UPI0037571C2E
MPELLFIIGLQKSGTSLLNRMLMSENSVTNPFLPEGKFFWGDDPPFNPELAPSGVLFQQHQGKHGHALNASAFKIEDQDLLQQRIEAADVSTPILMNKNPYNTVRIEWMKQLFPHCRIVCMVRHPLANVFSLYKKYFDHPHRGLAPEDGWWGTKPNHWQDLVCEDKLKQSAQQWLAVNQQVMAHAQDIDLIIKYDQLCAQPDQQLSHILQMCGVYQIDNQYSDLTNLDDEYLRGSRLLSKNRELRNNPDFKLKDMQEAVELPALTASQIQMIEDICLNVWQQF